MTAYNFVGDSRRALVSAAQRGPERDLAKPESPPPPLPTPIPR